MEVKKIIKTMKLFLHTDETTSEQFNEAAVRYASACDFVSQYVFDNDFLLSFLKLDRAVYHPVRSQFQLKSQMAQSVCKTVIARYKTVKDQLLKSPYKYKNEDGETCYITRTLEWLMKPVRFHRPQIDLVYNRDYSFTKSGLSINTLNGRVIVGYEKPDYYTAYFDGTWSFGTAKLVSLKGNWYLHIPVTKEIIVNFDESKPAHVVGIDRGLRFLVTTYDEQGKTVFYDGKKILAKREQFAQTRAELQSRGTKSAKRALKRISGRETRWMSDVNHQISKTLVQAYGPGTLFALEDLTGVSFADENLSNRNADGRRSLRSWAFYQLGQFLTYKAEIDNSKVITFNPKYSSQRCPKCGRILKENRHHDIHEYICDSCGYRSNDDRVAGMNMYFLGTLYVSGDSNPHFCKN